MLSEYFEKTKGTGILATADAEGHVNVAVYARPHVPDDLLEFVNRATAKKPEDRFADCGEILALLAPDEIATPHTAANERVLAVSYDSTLDAEVEGILRECQDKLRCLPGIRTGIANITNE